MVMHGIAHVDPSGKEEPTEPVQDVAKIAKRRVQVLATPEHNTTQHNNAVRGLPEGGTEVWAAPSEHQVQIHRMRRAAAKVQERQGCECVQEHPTRWREP